jgi:death-on-curing protein
MKMRPDFLTVEEVLEIHRDQIARYGGEGGLRDEGMLRSAVAMPASGSGDRYYHEDLFEMAAAYLYHIVRNHPFLDGNKRTGLVVALVFLDLNGVQVRASQAEIETLVRQVAEGKADKKAVADLFRARSG